MLRGIEHQNHSTVEELIDQGFKQANQFKRKVVRKSKETKLSQEDITIPNTRDHQEKPMGIRHAVEWFKATGGGAPLNCDGAISALRRERIAEKKKKLEKVKKDVVTCEKEITKAKIMMEKKGMTYNPKAKMDLRKTKHLPN